MWWWCVLYVCLFVEYVCGLCMFILFFFFKQKTAYEMRISDWSSDVCSSDLVGVECQDAVDAVEHETRLAPVQYLAAELHGQFANTEVECAIDVGIEQIGIVAGVVADLAGLGAIFGNQRDRAVAGRRRAAARTDRPRGVVVVWVGRSQW